MPATSESSHSEQTQPANVMHSAALSPTTRNVSGCGSSPERYAAAVGKMSSPVTGAVCGASNSVIVAVAPVATVLIHPTFAVPVAFATSVTIISLAG